MSGKKKAVLATSAILLVAIGLFNRFFAKYSTEEPAFQELAHPAHEGEAKVSDSQLCHAAGSREFRSLLLEHESARHPLETLIGVAEHCQKRFDSNVRDFTGVLIKRERHSDQLEEAVVMQVKVRRELVKDGQRIEPLSVYLKYQKPQTGREVIWVEGQNEGKLLVHEGSGLQKYLRLKLDPQGQAAMWGNRYPITEIGFRSVLQKAIQRATDDRNRGPCQVEIFCHQEFDGRPCTVLEAKHSKPDAGYTSHIARIYFDEEWEIPVKYSAYLWPKVPGGKPLLDEEYLWRDVRLNVGLDDADFDPENERYDFP